MHLECGEGFVHVEGHVSGAPVLGSYTNLTTQGCASICDLFQNVSKCCSYEWSPTDYTCNINQVCEGATQVEMPNYHFCRRSNDREGIRGSKRLAIDVVNTRQNEIISKTQNRQSVPGTNKTSSSPYCRIDWLWVISSNLL